MDKLYMWKRKNDARVKRNILTTVNYGFGLVIFWDCFMFSGIENLQNVEDKDPFNQVLGKSCEKPHNTHEKTETWAPTDHQQNNNTNPNTSKSTRAWLQEKPNKHGRY